MTGQQTPSGSRPRSRRAARPAATGRGPVTGNASARCVHSRLLCRVSCSGRARPVTAARGGSHGPAAAMERARSGSVPASAAGDPAAESAGAMTFTRHSRPNLGLREASPALLEIYVLAGRVEALVGDFAHPATRDMRPDHVVRSFRSSACLALEELPGQARRQAAEQAGAARRLRRARPPRSCGKPSGRCPPRWSATPAASPARQTGTGRARRVLTGNCSMRALWHRHRARR